MRTLYLPTPENLSVPHFDTTFDNRLVTRMPITRGKLIEAALAITGGELARYVPEDEPSDKEADKARCELSPEIKAKIQRFLQFYLAPLDVESQLVVFVDRHQQVLEIAEAGRGARDVVAFAFHQIVRRAVLHNAQAVILAHNHPGDEPKPSDADVDATKALMKALDYVEVELLDHFIFGANGELASMNDLGLIPVTALAKIEKLIA